jgi:hypothetical protein
MSIPRSSRCTFPKFHFHFLRIERCRVVQQYRQLWSFNAGERDETHLHHDDDAYRHHDGPGPNRVATERPGKYKRKSQRKSQRKYERKYERK